MSKRNFDQASGSVRTEKTKKIRFDGEDTEGVARPKEEGEDEDFEFDHSNLLEARRERKGKVNLDGYASADASSDEDAPSARRSKKAEPVEDDDDDDMFAVKAPATFADEKTAKKSTFLTEGDIEGQDYGSRTGYDEKGEAVMEAFNMTAELEEGKFDEQGNYVPKAADPDRFHDSWLQGMNRKDFERAKEAQRNAEKLAREKEEDAESEPVSSLPREQAWAALLAVMKPRETVPATLRRLGGGQNKSATVKNRWAKKKTNPSVEKATSSEPSQPTEEETEREKRKNAIEYFTSLIDRLMSLGDLTIYEETYESISYKLRASGGDVPSSKDGTMVSGPQWEYKWDASDTAEVFGPFGGAQMKGWADEGFFGDTALVRRIGDEEGSFGTAVGTDFFQ